MPRGSSGNKFFGSFSNHKPFVSDARISQKALSGRASRRSVTTLILLVVMFVPLPGMAQPTRIFFGDSAHPVVSGEAWLIANRWGAYQSVLVATIRNGKLEAHQAVQFPQDWEQAF